MPSCFVPIVIAKYLRVVGLLFLFIPSVAFAQQLTITGKSNLVIHSEDLGFRVAGTYIIKNLGPEPAREVFPSLRFSTQNWSGDPRILQPQQEERWDVSFALLSNALSCEHDITCAGLLLPTAGTYPVFVKHHYKDWSFYASSSPEVYLLPVEHHGEQKNAFPFFPVTLTFVPHSKQLLGKLSIKNISPNIKRVAVSFHTADELEVITKPFMLEIHPSQVSTAQIEVENQKGLFGSTYGFYVVLQWEEFSRRQSFAVATTLSLQRSDGFSLLSLGLGFFLLQILILGIFLVKRRSR